MTIKGRRGVLTGAVGLGGLVAAGCAPEVRLVPEASAQAVGPAVHLHGTGAQEPLAGATEPFSDAQPVPASGTLRIPPLLSPPLRNGVRTFGLTIQSGQTAFDGVRTTDTMGINSAYLGPTLRAKQGDAVAFAIANALGEPTTLHWHGMHVPAAMDSGPHQEIAPGATWRPSYTIGQEAATLWLHAHLMGSTRRQVTRGLAALFILDDDSPAQAVLPHTYGQDDIPLVLQQTFGGGAQAGRTLVNGTLDAVLETTQERLRLRVLNASDAQIYTLGFNGDVPFHQVASDGGLLPAPVGLTRLQLGPAERAELVVDLANAPGETPLVLRLFGGGGGRGGNAAQNAALLTIQAPGDRATRGAGLPPLPARLNTIERIDPARAAVVRQMVLNGRSINGQPMTTSTQLHDMSSALRVRQGDIERWEIVNASRQTHLFHVHDVQFQIVSRNGAAPGPAELGRKDTVMVRPGETVPLLMRFADYADEHTPYMFHCHVLQHEDAGMMGQFVVVPA